MSAFPVACQVEDDMMVNLVIVATESTMEEVAKAAADVVVGRRLRPKPGVLRVRRSGTRELLPQDLRVRDAGWRPLEGIEVVYA